MIARPVGHKRDGISVQKPRHGITRLLTAVLKSKLDDRAGIREQLTPQVGATPCFNRSTRGATHWDLRNSCTPPLSNESCHKQRLQLYKIWLLAGPLLATALFSVPSYTTNPSPHLDAALTDTLASEKALAAIV
jgi:hypothetical protein